MPVGVGVEGRNLSTWSMCRKGQERVNHTTEPQIHLWIWARFFCGGPSRWFPVTYLYFWNAHALNITGIFWKMRPNQGRNGGKLGICDLPLLLPPKKSPSKSHKSSLSAFWVVGFLKGAILKGKQKWDKTHSKVRNNVPVNQSDFLKKKPPDFCNNAFLLLFVGEFWTYSACLHLRFKKRKRKSEILQTPFQPQPREMHPGFPCGDGT